MLIKLNGTGVQTIGGTPCFPGTPIDLPDPQAQALLDTGKAVPWVVVRLLKIYRVPGGAVYNPGETAGWDPKTAAMLIKAGVAEPCTPS